MFSAICFLVAGVGVLFWIIFFIFELVKVRTDWPEQVKRPDPKARNIWTEDHRVWKDKN